MKIKLKKSQVEIVQVTYAPAWITEKNTCDICFYPLEESGKDLKCVIAMSVDGTIYRFHEKCYHKGLNES
tara:strand:+ start:194 stop:403 length:210 start_codon:yes stop_codon:yes gene_type:complete